MKKTILTFLMALLLPAMAHSTVIALHETTANLGAAFGNDFKLTMFANWTNQNLMNAEIYGFFGSGTDGTYGISGMCNTSDMTAQSGYDYIFGCVGTNPVFKIGSTSIRLQSWDADLDGWAAISPATGNIATTGTITGKIATATDADAHTLTEAEYHGGSVLATGASIHTLPPAAAGLSGCVEAGQGVTAIIQLLPASGDYIVKAGIRGTAATALKSGGAAGDKICYVAYNDSDWYVQTVGAWAE